MLQEIKIEYEGPRKIEIGDVFYSIHSADSQYFRAVCPVCKDSKQVTVNEVTFACPVCHSAATVCKAHAYVVQRWRVCAFKQFAFSDKWKADSHRFCEIRLYSGKQGKATQYAEINLNSFVLHLNKSGEPSCSHYIYYDDYRLACEEAKRLTDEQKDALTKYNAEHGTNFEFIQKSKNDAKSR